ncbi:hypothetical protein [Aliiroseovarius zhejiangensis]|uniref:hypothetical protein n=1 Tax=Aliiroseovarius zhejiangensis TaxID=1632025 RepID=UPI0017482669|nr:hypothetical protein [Aliiroseovarius zhejiangensis]
MTKATERESLAAPSRPGKNPLCLGIFAGKQTLNCGAATVADRKIKGQANDRGTEEEA